MIDLPHILDGEDKSSPFKNCIRNRYRQIRKWAKRVDTNCFRIYNREIPQYPVDIDFYAGRFCIHYFSYEEDEEKIKMECNKVLKELFQAENIFWRTRFKRKKLEQYEKQSQTRDFFLVREFGAIFKVNLRDYLDTGLFLDHRETRKIVASFAKGKRVLNLFAYTCAFTVHAAVAGASFTKSVDLSKTYLAWGKENMILNSLSLENHVFVREDCLRFLDQELFSGEKYDLIVIDPPTISRSKKIEQMFEIQKEYATLIKKSLELLEKEGKIFFSTNSRKFRLDRTLFPNCLIEEISETTLPLDFSDKKIHRCWIIKNDLK